MTRPALATSTMLVLTAVAPPASAEIIGLLDGIATSLNTEDRQRTALTNAEAAEESLAAVDGQMDLVTMFLEERESPDCS